ncbi:MAG: alpha/beta fold hydrolase [Kordiimonas sp.]
MTDYTEAYFTNPDGLKQFYRDYNCAPKDAPTILCMPGLTRNSKDFADIAAHMADRCRVICVEQRGRGLSHWDPDPTRYRPDVYVNDMMVLLKHIDVQQVIAFGTSLGGLMTIMMSALHPGTLIGAIINDIGPVVDPVGIARIKSYVGKGTPPTTWADAIEAVKHANTGVYPKFTESDWESFTRKLYIDVNDKPVLQYDPTISRNFEDTNDQSAPDLWGIFSSLYNIPVVTLRGALSDILSAETLSEMTKRHPDLTPVTVPDKGHVPMMTEPECIEAIDTLIEKFTGS